jgi:hypothetical protein
MEYQRGSQLVVDATYRNKELENETVKEFDAKFENLLQQIPSNHHPRKDYLLFLYIKDFPGHFGYFLKDKGPKTIEESQEMVAIIEANISSCKVEPFYAPRAKDETKPRNITQC